MASVVYMRPFRPAFDLPMTMIKRICGIALLAVLIQAGPADADDSLYQALGARDGITKIATLTIDLCVADARIKARFFDTNLNRLKRLLADQFCVLSGGPCTYGGRTMKETHATMKLTNADFNALVEDLQTAMDRQKIPFRTQNRLLAILAPLERDIVTR
jgi:hemoglobin